jgi:hypothetical protein
MYMYVSMNEGFSKINNNKEISTPYVRFNKVCVLDLF